MPKGQFAEGVLRKGWKENAALLASLGRAFLLRLPSECLLLFEQRAGENLKADDRLDKKAGAGKVGGKLMMERRKRRHMAPHSPKLHL